MGEHSQDDKVSKRRLYCTSDYIGTREYLSKDGNLSKDLIFVGRYNAKQLVEGTTWSWSNFKFIPNAQYYNGWWTDLTVVACVVIPDKTDSKPRFRIRLLPKIRATKLAGGFPGENINPPDPPSVFSWLCLRKKKSIPVPEIPFPDKPNSNREWGKKLFAGILQAPKNQKAAAAPAASGDACSVRLQRMSLAGS